MPPSTETPPAPSLTDVNSSEAGDSPQPFSYDFELLNSFLELVFGDDPKGYPALWVAKGRPAYPMSTGAFRTRLKRLDGTLGGARALYYGTSTLNPSRDENGDTRLFNRGEAFHGLYAVVLDDLGTKIPLDRLPADLQAPTYKIETSPGNFQYGYVLDTPIFDFEQARALIQIVYDSGYTDGGGAMPTKLVRLPDGINGKPGANRDFRVRAESMTIRKFTPPELLRALGSEVKWEDIVESAAEAMRRRRSARSSSAWSAAQSPSAEGVVDPVLEWLYEQGLVRQEKNEWVDIRCPWCDEHTDGDTIAGYSPLGRGDERYINMRGFHCFHDHCRNRGPSEFLAWVAVAGGPEAAVSELHSAELMKWVFEPAMNAAIQAFGWPMRTDPVAMAGFANLYPRKVRVPKAEGGTRDVKEVALWLSSPARVDVAGITVDPSNPAPIVTCPSNGTLLVNRYRRPNFGDGDIDPDDEERWLDFIEYLIPDQAERDYFLDWISMKVVNPAFRGCGVLMTTTTQGTGRGTLAKMLDVLLGSSNVKMLPFDKVTGDARYNVWQLSPLVIINETLELGDGQSFYRAYERLKGLIDPLPTHVEVNPKYGRTFDALSHASYLMFSNHANAVGFAANDRRLYIISNTLIPREGAYFTELHRWIDEGEWAQSIYRWMKERTETRDMGYLNAPPPASVSKEEMRAAAMGLVEKAFNSVLDNWRGRFITQRQIFDVFRRHPDVLRFTEDKQLERILQHLLRQNSTSAYKLCRIRPFKDRLDLKVRPRILHSALRDEPKLVELRKGPTDDVPAAAIQHEARENTPELIASWMHEGLDD